MRSSQDKLDNPLWQAGAAVTESLTQFEGAMDDLVARMEITGEQMHKLMVIKGRAENVLNQITGYAQAAVNDVKRDPKPYIALAAVVGFFLIRKQSAPKLGGAATVADTYAH